MPRPGPEERLASIATAATKVFGRLGYRGTRVTDVAAAAGISSGSVFNYVESKEALLHLVFAHGFGALGDAVPPLPLRTPLPGETVELIRQSLRKVPTPRLRTALVDDAPGDVAAELRSIVEERYDTVAQLWPLLAVIERCAVDLPELERMYFGDVRGRYFEQLVRYLGSRSAQGAIRALHDTALTARVITESIAWFAWKRHEGRDALTYDDAAARATVVEFVCSSLLERT
jgi:AcrR family transcriptional regulator